MLYYIKYIYIYIYIGNHIYSISFNVITFYILQHLHFNINVYYHVYINI